MIRHTVSFALVHAPGSAAEREFLETGRLILSGISGVENFIVSRQVSPKSDHAFQFSMSFENQAAYDAYDSHPDHRAFVTSRWQVEVITFQELDLVAMQ